ncbi:MAG: hypothetical protein R6X19_09630 [Kiritimatiellia bacterium]
MRHPSAAIPRFQFSEPKANLPTLKVGILSAEERFTVSFAHAYLKQHILLHSRSPKTTLSLVQEIPVNGYGITDLLAVAWTRLPSEKFPSAEAFVAVAKPTCRAFEMKLNNWQKALSQASRYRNFAHQAIVVLPPNVCANALRVLGTFKSIRVGLWSFDPTTCQINSIFTPRPHAPRSTKYWLQSIQKASKAPRSILPIHEIG